MTDAERLILIDIERIRSSGSAEDMSALTAALDDIRVAGAAQHAAALRKAADDLKNYLARRRGAGDFMSKLEANLRALASKPSKP